MAEEDKLMGVRISDGQTTQETMDNKYKDEDWLREKYNEEHWTMKNIADCCGISMGTVQYWMNKYNIERRDKWAHLREADRKYKNKKWMLEKYVDGGCSATEMAKLADCDVMTILTWLDKHGIDRRSHEESASSNTPHFYTSERGYEIIGDTKNQISVHRLVSISHFGTNSVKNKVVHHKNGIPWDNRPENLEIMTNKEHGKLHAEKRRRKILGRE